MRRALAILLCACAPETAEVVADGVELAHPGRSGESSTAVVGDETLSVELIDDDVVFEGDVLIDTVATRSAGRLDRRWRWQNGIVPYELDPAIGSTQRTTIAAAIDHWNRKTAYRLRPRRPNDRDAVRFVPGPGCSSYVGRQGGVQPIALATGCSTGNVIHEIGHAVGLWHEQSRRDRDNYIVIHWESIQPDKAYNFLTYDAIGQDGRDLGAYDLESIMHYPYNAFSADGHPTITTITGALVTGQRRALTPGDIAGAARLLRDQEQVAE